MADKRRNKKKVPPNDMVMALLNDGLWAFRGWACDVVHKRVYYLILHFFPLEIIFFFFAVLLSSFSNKTTALKNHRSDPATALLFRICRGLTEQTVKAVMVSVIHLVRALTLLGSANIAGLIWLGHLVIVWSWTISCNSSLCLRFLIYKVGPRGTMRGTI